MPELPEVESLRRSLQPFMRRTIAAVNVRLPVAIRTHRPQAFARLLQGKMLRRTGRRGKALLIHLSGSRVLVVHFRLWGLLRYVADGAAPDRETAAVLHLRGDGALELRELQLSTVELYRERDLARVEALAKLGVDPLSAAFTKLRFRTLVRGRAAVRALLTDQTRIAGIGNLWAHEILHAARLRPDRLAGSLSPAEVDALYGAVRRVLRRAVALGGEPEFTDALGCPGRARLAVYGRGGQPCPRRDGTITAGRAGGRPSFYCPACQR